MPTQVDYKQTLGASVDKAWLVLGDFGSLLSWVKGGDVGTLSLSGDGIGMVRDFTLPSVGTVQHRLDALDQDRHLLTYSLTSGRPLGMATYAVTIQLAPLDEGRCSIIWTGHFDAEHGIPVEDMATNLQDAYRGMSERLDSFLNSNS